MARLIYLSKLDGPAFERARDISEMKQEKKELLEKYEKSQLPCEK